MTTSLDNLMTVIPTMPVEKLVKLFVKTREAKAAATREYEAKKAEFERIMEACENQMLAEADRCKVEGFKTPFGTTYTATDVKISIADHEAFQKFVKEQDDLEFFQARVAVARVQDYMEKNSESIPPGLNVFRERKMRVRKA